MKRDLFLFAALIFIMFTLRVNAQFKVGLQAGVNLADASLDAEQWGFVPGIRLGFTAGGIISYNFSPLLGLQIEPAYIQKGSSIDITATDAINIIKAEGTLSVDYIDVPILFKVSFVNEKLKPFIAGGASISFLLGDSKLKIDKYSVNGEDVTETLPAQEKEQLLKTKSTDFLLNIGGGILIPAGKTDILVEVQYNLGLTNINDQPNDNRSIKTIGIQMKAGALFSL